MTTNRLDRLRTLFAQEAEQRLGRLGQLVLDLEQRGADDAPGATAETIAEVFREVHTLKGSAAVVGLDTVGEYAHVVEEHLARLRAGTLAPTPAIIDALLGAVDRLGTLIWESVGGQHADPATNAAALAVLAAACAARPAEPSVALPPPVAAPTRVVPPAPPAPAVAPAPAPVPAVGPAPAAVTNGRTDRARESAGTVMVPVERLDELVRMVGEAASAQLRMGNALLARAGLGADELSEFTELSRLLNALQDRAMRTRMVPVATITEPLQRTARDIARNQGKDLRWEVRGEDTELDRGVLLQLSDSLLHLVRNAVDHGIDDVEERRAAGKPDQAVVRLHAMQLGSEVIIAVSDDGRGIDLDRVRERAARSGIDVSEMTDEEVLQLIFHSGFSTAAFVSDISGRGVGLDAVRASVESARGRVEVRSTPGVGSEFRIVVPITLAVLRCLLVETGGQRFALPLHRVAHALAERETVLLHAAGRTMIEYDGEPLVTADLAEVLDLPPSPAPPTPLVGSVPGDRAGTFVIVNATVGRRAFRVDALVGQRDVVVKGLSPLFPRLDVVAGAGVEADGSILFVLDPPGLVERAQRQGGRHPTEAVPAPSPAPATRRRSGRLLVVDDALTVRELQRAILERAGFDVTVASDGVEALAQLHQSSFELVVTDVEMPRMDGFALTEQIRANPTFGNTAVLILTSLASDTDRRRGMEVGADGYIVKSAFDEQSLLGAVDRLIGASA